MEKHQTDWRMRASRTSDLLQMLELAKEIKSSSLSSDLESHLARAAVSKLEAALKPRGDENEVMIARHAFQRLTHAIGG